MIIAKVSQYLPLVYLVSVAMVLATLNVWVAYEWVGDVHGPWRIVMVMMGYFLAILAFLKLIDLKAFVGHFQSYDMLSQRVGVYGVCYPFFELFLAFAFLSGLWPLPSGFLAVALGAIGGWSIIYRLFIKKGGAKTKLSCACAGGPLQLPLGIISIIENLMMILMGAILLGGALL
ncbi:MAG: hypothetical protein OXC40_05860 [Proteobacteria bacterium]|nr:hypothetical protein [Pseudomonadota bacterium]